MPNHTATATEVVVSPGETTLETTPREINLTVDASEVEVRPGNATLRYRTEAGTRTVPSDGWFISLTHPETGRTRTPTVIDLQNAPVYNPGPNQQPVVRIPVPKDEVWLSDAFDSDPEMSVWRDGERLPIEVLRNVEQREDATILVGVGGVELEDRVTEEYNDKRRHLAVRDLVETETEYGVDAPEPVGSTVEDQTQQTADSDAEFATAFTIQDTDPFIIENGSIRPTQTSFTVEAETELISILSADPRYSDGEATGVGGGSPSVGDSGVYTFTPEHRIENGELYWRREAVPDQDGDPGAVFPGFDVRVNGSDIERFPDGFEFSSNVINELEWEVAGVGDLPTLPANEPVEIEIEVTEANYDFSSDPDFDDYGEFRIDLLTLTDENVGHSFDNTVHEDNGYLDAPRDFAPVQIVGDTIQSPYNITAARGLYDISDTSGAQRIQLSNDGGTTWLPTDGAEDNTSSLTVESFPDPGTSLRQRIRLDGYEPIGPRAATPRLGYTGQVIGAYELFADVNLELLLIEETFDNSLASVLSDIGEPAERSWGLQTDANGDIVVRFVQNGQFTADFTPEFSDRTREKLGKTYESVTVKGSNEPESNVPYTASTSYTALPRNNILTGSETVYDDTTNYERGSDYEMRYRDGEIRATDGGDLTLGDDYRIDFRYQAQGTFEAPDAPSEPDELVETVPGVTSERLAEQVAFVIASEVDAPRYAAEVTIPDPDPRFDPTEGLPPSALSLPASAGDLEVRGEPQLTEEGLAVRFGTRPAVEASIQRLSRQLSRVSDRS